MAYCLGFLYWSDGTGCLKYPDVTIIALMSLYDTEHSAGITINV